MSKSIANLEKEVGFPLFHRSVAGVKPTTEARELYLYFRTVFKGYEGLKKKIKNIGNQTQGILNIIWPEFFALTCDKKEYAMFSEKNPEIKIYTMEEKEETVLHFLREGLADAAFMYAPIPKDLRAHTLVGKEPLCALINQNHSLANKEEVTLENLADNTLLFSKGNAITAKNVIKKAKELSGMNLEFEEIPYALMLHTVYTKEFVALAPASVFRYMNFPELVCKPVKYNGEDFYTLECYLVTLKQENYRSEVEKYITYEKMLHSEILVCAGK